MSGEIDEEVEKRALRRQEPRRPILLRKVKELIEKEEIKF